MGDLGGSDSLLESEENLATGAVGDDFFSDTSGEENEEVSLSTDELDSVLEDVSEEDSSVESPSVEDHEPDIISDDFFSNDDDGGLSPSGEESLPQEAPQEADLSTDAGLPNQGVLNEKEIGTHDIDQAEMRKVVSYLDNLLGELPDHVIRKFAQSEYFDLYKKVMDQLGV